MRSIEDLPNEILTHIFSFLSLPDRLDAGLVSHHWLDVISWKKFHKNIIIFLTCKENQPEIVQKSIDQYYPNIMNVFSKTQRKFTDYRLVSVDLGHKEVTDLWSNISEHIESLSIIACLNVSSANVARLLRSAPKLKSLEVDGIPVQETRPVWSAVDFEKFGRKNVVKIRMHVGQGLDRAKLISSLYNFAPKLESFDCDFEFDTSILADSRTLIKFNKFLANYAKSLKKICIRNPNSLDSLIECNKKGLLKLNSLHINDPFVDFEKLEIFLKTQPQLTEFVLNYTHFSGDMIEAICKITNLQNCELQLNLYSSFDDITDSGLQQLKKFNDLRNLNLRGSLIQISDTAFQLGLLVVNLDHLVDLRLDDINITDNAFNSIFPRITNLTYLQITKSPRLLTNSLLKNIFKYLINLQQLVLYGNDKLTSAGFISDSETGFQIDRLRHLRVLWLENFQNLDDWCMDTFKFSQLIDLSLMRCPKITLHGLEIVVQNCPSIQVFRLLDNEHFSIDEEFAQEIADKSLRRLKRVLITHQNYNCKCSYFIDTSLNKYCSS